LYFLSKDLAFPPVTHADTNGILALGGDLSLLRLKMAYEQGIFPWYNEGEPIVWYSPDPRMVLFPTELRISKSMKQLLNKQYFEVSFNTSFEAVITSCAYVKRANQSGTWITQDMKEAYINLHEAGLAMSTEVWQEGKLVGGLYGIWLEDKKVFCGESMFTKVSNASKYGFIKLVQKLTQQGVRMIDCQVHTQHLESLGAREIPRKEFIEFLK